MVIHKHKFYLLQTLRGVAAILVMLYHATGDLKLYFVNKIFFSGWFNFGSAGVDIFFVLSGFIITYSSLRLIEDRRYGKYFMNRIYRIYPIYWIVFLFFLIPHFLFPSVYNEGYPLRLITIISSFFLLPNHKMINGVSWTLVYELFFYILFALMFYNRNKVLALLFFLIYSFAIVVNYFFISLPVLTLSPLILEFFLGISIYFISEYLNNKVYNSIILYSGIFLFLVVAMLKSHNLLIFKSELERVIYYGLPAFLTIYGCIIYETRSSVTIPKIILLTGNASYVLYLVHLPFLVASVKLLAKSHIQNFIILNIIVLLIGVGIIFSSIVIHLKIEIPLQRFFKSRFSLK